MPRHGKRYRAAAQKIDADKKYELKLEEEEIVNLRFMKLRCVVRFIIKISIFIIF